MNDTTVQRQHIGTLDPQEGTTMQTYTVNYHTGAGNFTIKAEIHDVLTAADRGVSYTQQDVTIEDEHGNEIARRLWSSVLDDFEDEDEGLICFGTFGCYADWIYDWE